MGLDWDKVIKIDTEHLLGEFGKKKDKTRNEATIEDLADCINFYLDEQEAGNLPMNLFFAIDSIGVLNSNMSATAIAKGNTENNMWNAGAYEHAFKSIVNTRIPSSRKTTKEFTNTLVAVQKIWIDSMGAGVVKHKGGESFFHAARLIYHHGGIASHGTRAVAATSLGQSVRYGVETNVSVSKNHIDGPLGGLSMEGKLVSTIKGFITPDGTDEFKKDNILFFRKMLGEKLSAEDIKDKYIQIQTVGDDEEQNIEDFNDTMKANFRKPDIGDVDDVDKETGEVK